MSEQNRGTQRTGGGADGARDRVRPLVAHVQRIARLLTSASHAPEATMATHAAESTAAADWTVRFAAVCESFGLASRARELSVRDVFAIADEATPWCTLVPTDAGGERWVAVTARRGRALRVWVQEGTETTDRWLRPQQLAELIGGGSKSAPRTWIAAESEYPLASLRRLELDPEALPRLALERLRRLVRDERKAIWIIVSYSVAVGVLTLATPLTVQVLVNTVAFGSLIQPLVVLALVLFGLLSFAGLLRILESYVSELLQRRLFARVVTDFAHRIPRVCPSVHREKNLPELVNRYFEIVGLQKSASTLLLDGIEVFLQATIGLTVLAFYHPLLLAFDAVVVGVLLFITVVLGRGAIGSSLTESNAKYQVAAWLESLAGAPDTYRSRRGAVLAAEHANHLANVYLARRRSHFRILFRQVIGMVSLQVVTNTLLLGLGGWLVLSGELTLGQLVAAELIVNAVMASISKFGKHFESFYDVTAAVTKLGKVVDLPLESMSGVAVPDGAGPLAVRVRNVTVTGSAGPMLRDVTLDLAAGSKVAVTGPACAGKSTLLELLFRLREPASGVVEINGVELRSLSRAVYREHVAYVGSAEIIEATIEENVRMGRAQLSAGCVQDALDQVGLLPELARLPEGLATQVSQPRLPLSESQRIQLALARAIAGRPRLLLVDSVLDLLHPSTRSHLLNALTAATAPWTLVVATHADDVTARCSLVVGLESGGIAHVKGRP